MIGMHNDEEQFECPECGSGISVGTASCPGCGMALEWDDEQTEEALDELIEQMEEAEDEETGSEYDPSPGPEVVAPSTSDEVVEAPVEEAPMALKEPVKKKKALSMLGMAFAVLAIVSIIGLMVLLNYDTWISGDAENNIGDTQVIYVYLGMAAVVVCLLIVVFDFVRNRKAV
jgi:hypothetical protein